MGMQRCGLRIKIAGWLFNSLFLLFVFWLMFTVIAGFTAQGEEERRFVGRHLLSDEDEENCTPPAIEQFPRPMFSESERKHGAIAIHVIVSVYMFLALAIVCDDYFVPSLESISLRLKLHQDVAGATFMAAGSSAPELATAVIGVFVAKDDIGVGAVVGSAVFNIMFVISVCALFAGMVTYLSWWPLIRDSTFYMFSIAALILTLYDGYVEWYESVALLLLYLLYIVIMVFNSWLEEHVAQRITTSCCSTSSAAKAESETVVPVTHKDSTNLLVSAEANGSVANYEMVRQSSPERDSNQSSDASDDGSSDSSSHSPVKTHLDGEGDSHFSPPKGFWKRSLWASSIPIYACLYFTVPDCRKARWRGCYVVTFLMSCIWISAFSYIMVWMIAIIGYTFRVPDTVLGLTFIAAGASVPDAIASLLVAKDGFGDMAVSNAIGSNVFDINLCLGLPWFLKTVIIDPNTKVKIRSKGLTYSAVTLLSTVAFLIISIHLNGWKLNKKYGVLLMVVYILYMVLASLYELNVFSYANPPACDSDY